MEQISDFMKQLYEYFYLKKNEIKKAQKNISSELLASFGRQLTEPEDIPAQLNDSVLNWDNCSKEGDACQEEMWKKKKKIESKVIVQAGIVDNLPKIQQRLWKHTFQKTGRHRIEFTFRSWGKKKTIYK